MARNIIELIAELQEIVDAGYGHLVPLVMQVECARYRLPQIQLTKADIDKEESDEELLAIWGGPEEVDCYEHATHILL